jgi:phasin family protein
MYTSPNPFDELQQAGMQALFEFARAQIAALERLSALNIGVVRSAFKDGSDYAKALLVGTGTPELSRLSAALAVPALDRSIAYSLSMCELGSQAQGEMARLVDAQASGLGRGVAAGLDRLAQLAPQGSGAVVKAVKSVVDTANSAFDSLTEFGVKTSAVAQAKFAAAGAGIADAEAEFGKLASQTGKGSRNNKNRKKAV